MDGLDPSVFKRMFRVDRETFDFILCKVEPLLSVANTKACNSSGVPITSRTRLAVTLRWLAGGSYLDLCFAWGIGLSTFFSENGVLWPTLQAIDEVLKMGLPFDDEEKLEELSSGLAHHSGGVLNGCVMAMD